LDAERSETCLWNSALDGSHDSRPPGLSKNLAVALPGCDGLFWSNGPRAPIALQWPMPELTRKRVNDRPQTWYVHFAGVRVGAIIERSGAPPSGDRWEWHCGFYPGSNPGEQRFGTAADFNTARAAFEVAWREYLPKRSKADFEEWREDAACHAAKYARWDRKGERRI
jgi:hypothetical protein